MEPPASAWASGPLDGLHLTVGGERTDDLLANGFGKGDLGHRVALAGKVQGRGGDQDDGGKQQIASQGVSI